MKKLLSSEDVFELDSFKALCADIGIDLTKSLVTVDIKLNTEEAAIVAVTYYAYAEGES